MRDALEDIVEARLRGNLERLSELTLARLYQEHVGTGHSSFALLSSWRHGEPADQNRHNIERLHQQLRSVQIGFSRLIAHERDGDAWLKAPWVWAHGITLHRALKLAREYRQSSVAYCGAEVGAEFQVRWLDVSTGAITHMDRFPTVDPALIAAFYFQRGLRFEYVAQGFFEGLWMGVYEKRFDQRLPKTAT